MFGCCSEMSWLITTAWDTGCKHAQYGHHAQALSFLAAAIELMDFCDAFKDTKEVHHPIREPVLQDLTYQVLHDALPCLVLP